ncbi:MAG: hypothetical protein US86_C0001G0379 [Candidatus Daviesbacteria bacterium GW2011_GWA2_38_24]|uniref:Uncharacterized protein n=1 Tax=Candidatus Daviesbacteria bacterium GW2011_GWA2_38_24 TaxID=1618422 RepID=A0A0G0JKQ4_9BACT|nr:MAG: hypothetical protein US86_C0001G0379 [Candidatus Daviesbacteria bacterium GW2011_GWA2_38_24]OGE23808.1 MAG: hypothetical protein A2688_01100 [Candidatus Daviesbacteria bacterium RIFCSPHIGHO2_01_FULL_38_8]
MAETKKNQFLLEELYNHLSKSKQQEGLSGDPIETTRAMLHFCASPDQIPNQEINRLASVMDLMTTPGSNQIDIRVATESETRDQPFKAIGVSIPTDPYFEVEPLLPHRLQVDPLPPFLSLIGEASALRDKLSGNSLKDIIRRSQAFQSEMLHEIDCLARRLKTPLEGSLPNFGRYQSGLASLGLDFREYTKRLLIN